MLKIDLLSIGPWIVYKFFKGETLLYTGFSNAQTQANSLHRPFSPGHPAWGERPDSLEIVSYKTEEEARDAEAWSIKNERPFLAAERREDVKWWLGKKDKVAGADLKVGILYFENGFTAERIARETGFSRSRVGSILRKIRRVYRDGLLSYEAKEKRIITEQKKNILRQNACTMLKKTSFMLSQKRMP